MSKPAQSNDQSDKIPFRLHPRVFASLGSELVTNDVVAIIELVKNSYDAFATRVDVRFVIGDTGEMRIEIEDNGTGMTRSVIEEVWCVVATPYRLSAPFSTQGEGSRRVSGEKGLGRLSAARLGGRLSMVTKSARERCWRVDLSWSDLASADSLDSCNVELRECANDKDGLTHRGTIVRISDLNSKWSDERIQDLKEQLSRLISPFAKIVDFEIRLTPPGEQEADPVKIESPEFLAKPPYLIKGRVDRAGLLKCKYLHTSGRGERSESITERLRMTGDGEGNESGKSNRAPRCRAFEFEIRAWDIDPDSIENIAQRFNANKSTIRKDIRNYRGVSLYRDGILVLPKSDSARDWLGLDLRRVSKVGERLSTSQIVGYVAITAEKNPEIKDTSDRERLEHNGASEDFAKLLVGVVRRFENERGKDRLETAKEPPFKDLFASLSARPLLERISRFAMRGGDVGDLIPFVEEYDAHVTKTVGQIERRLIYYSRLASLGVLAAVIIHEVRNHTLTISGLTRELRKLVVNGEPAVLGIKKDLEIAERGVESLERLADRYAPLASRALRKRRRDSVLEVIIKDCLAMREQEIKVKKVEVEIESDTETKVAVDPGELTAVLINLIDNSLYWLSQKKNGPRRIKFEILRRKGFPQVNVRVHDSGPGVRGGDEERIFYPGVTNKPEGIGMGLTVASEIVAEHGGTMHLFNPGHLNGASFGFELPLSTEAQ